MIGLRRLFGTLTAVLLAAAPAFSQTAAQSPQELTRIEVSGEEIRFTGRITMAAASEFASLLSGSDGGAVTLLRIDSPGGDANAGLAIAALVGERQLSVVVERSCNSACAVYILPAAAQARFEPDSFITLHWMPSPTMGMLAAESMRRRMQSPAGETQAGRIDASMQNLVARQQLFYRSINVDPASMEAIMDVWLELHRQLTRLHKALNPNRVAFVPDNHFIQDCLGLRNVAWRNFDVADSIIYSRAGLEPRAFLIEGYLYLEGERVSERNFSCPADPSAAPSS